MRSSQLPARSTTPDPIARASPQRSTATPMRPCALNKPGDSRWEACRHISLGIARWCAALSLFAAPLNKPATVVLLALALIGSLLGPKLFARCRIAVRDRVVKGFLLWWLVLFASCLHAWLASGSRPFADSQFLVCGYPLILASVLQTARWRWRALAAFAVATALVLAGSYAMQFGVLPQRSVVEHSPYMRNTVFKEYTQQGLSTLILFSMAISVACWTASRFRRWALGAIAMAAVINVGWLLHSRTSYTALLPLTIYWIWALSAARWKTHKALMACAVFASTFILLLACSPQINHRLIAAVSSEASRYLSKTEPTSTGIRLWLWEHTVPIVADAPVFGHGFRQWGPEYTARMASVPGSGPFIAGHPHQEFLLILAEEGGVGLTIFAVLLVALMRLIRRLPEPQRGIFASIVLIYLTAGLTNGLWADFTHRHVFVLLIACIPMSSMANRPRDPVQHP